MGVYEHNPNAAPDSAFEPGALRHLVPGNEGRMLDPRRTPVRIAGLKPAVGAFEVDVLAFEDAGARWEVDYEDVSCFQFAKGSRGAADDAIGQMERDVARLGKVVRIAADEQRRLETRERLRAERVAARSLLSARRTPSIDLARREGASAQFAALAAFLEARGLLEMECAFAERFVSNPASGELVKGHCIVLAELGLVPYEGKAVRDVGLFDPPWTREERGRHLIARLAFVHELFAAAGLRDVVLYRGISTDGSLEPHPPKSLVSTTFDRAVAESLFDGGPTTTTGALFRQVVPIERLFMTFAETQAMNRSFREAEAVLLGDHANRAF